jgi:hypothetical protein
MKDLELNNTTLKLSSSTDGQFTDLKAFSYTYDPITHFFTVQVEKGFKKDKIYTFSVDFKGLTKDDELGFYRGYYFDDNNKKKYFFKNII